MTEAAADQTERGGRRDDRAGLRSVARYVASHAQFIQRNPRAVMCQDHREARCTTFCRLLLQNEWCATGTRGLRYRIEKWHLWRRFTCSIISDNRGICRSATAQGVTIGRHGGQVIFVTA